MLRPGALPLVVCAASHPTLKTALTDFSELDEIPFFTMYDPPWTNPPSLTSNSGPALSISFSRDTNRLSTSSYIPELSPFRFSAKMLLHPERLPRIPMRLKRLEFQRDRFLAFRVTSNTFPQAILSGSNGS
jgi:hypothetical protein